MTVFPDLQDGLPPVCRAAPLGPAMPILFLPAPFLISSGLPSACIVKCPHTDRSRRLSFKRISPYPFRPHESQAYLSKHGEICSLTSTSTSLFLCPPIIHRLGHTAPFGPATYGILSYYICRSCAYAYLYRNERDPQSIQLQEMLARDGIEATAAKVSGLDPQVAEEKLVLDLIVCAHRDICAQDPLENSN